MGIGYSTYNIQKFIEETIDIKDSGNKYINVNCSQIATDLTVYLMKLYSSDPFVEKCLIRKWFSENWDKNYEMNESTVYEIRKAYAKDREHDEIMIIDIWEYFEY